MKYLLLIFGILLVIGGGLSIYSGYNIIEIERGWASVLAGTTAATGGFITIGLALVLRSLDHLQTALPTLGQVAPIKPVRGSSEPSVAIPDIPIAPPASPLGTTESDKTAAAFQIPASTADARSNFDNPLGELPGLGEAPVEASASGAVEPPKPTSKMRPLPRATTAFGEAAAEAQAEVSPSLDEIWRRVAVAAKPVGTSPASQSSLQEVVQEEPPPLAPTQPASPEEQPEIIGRYESDGTAYVMFADGSIEAQSEQGLFRFKSMTELKAFFQT